MDNVYAIIRMTIQCNRDQFVYKG